MEITTTTDFRKRGAALIDAWREADEQTYVDFRVGKSSEGEHAVLISFGDDHHPFIRTEAAALLSAVRSAIETFPEEASKEGFDNLEAGLARVIRMLGSQ